MLLFNYLLLSTLIITLLAAWLLWEYRFSIVSASLKSKWMPKMLNHFLVQILRVFRHLYMLVLFKFFYRLKVSKAFREHELRPKIYISPHFYGSFDRYIIQYIVPDCFTVALVGFEPYGRYVEDALPVTKVPIQGNENDDFFAEASNILKSGKSIWFAPEGSTTVFPFLGKLKAGFIKLALMMDRDIEIIPCWWQFESIHVFRSTLFIEFGEAIRFERVEVDKDKKDFNEENQPSQEWTEWYNNQHFQLKINILHAFDQTLRSLASFENQYRLDSIQSVTAEPLNEWIRLRSLEVWCNAGRLSCLNERLKFLQHCCTLCIPYPQWVETAVKEEIFLRLKIPEPYWFTQLLSSPVGLSTSCMGRIAVARSWYWSGSVTPSGSVLFYHDIRNRLSFASTTLLSDIYCKCSECSETVPIIGKVAFLRPSDIKVYHIHVGVNSANLACRLFSKADDASLYGIVPSVSDKGLLHIIMPNDTESNVEKNSIIRKLFSDKQFTRYSTLWLPCPPGEVNALRASMCKAENENLQFEIADQRLGVFESSTEVSAAIITRQNLLDCAMVEKSFFRHLGGDRKTGELISNVLAFRAFDEYWKCRVYDNHLENDGVLLDLGGNDGFRTVGVAAALQFPLSSCIIWESEFIDIPDHNPFRKKIKRFVHTDESPFVSISADRFRQPSSSVSMILALQSLHHVKDSTALDNLLKAMYTVLRPNGLVILKEHDCPPEYVDFITKLHELKDSSSHQMSPPRLLKSREQWHQLMTLFGFKRLEPISCNPDGYATPVEVQEGDRDIMLPDPKAHPYRTFIDVFQRQGRIPLFSQSLSQVHQKILNPVQTRPLWVDLRMNAWRPGQSQEAQRVTLPLQSESKIDAVDNNDDDVDNWLNPMLGQVGFCIPKGKWDNLVCRWFHHDPSICHIESNQIFLVDLLVCGINSIPRAYCGRMLDSEFCIRRTHDRRSVLNLAAEACTRSTGATIFYVPRTVSCQGMTKSEFLEVIEQLGLPLIFKTEKDVYVCRSLDTALLFYDKGYKSVLAQEWLPTEAIFKVEVVGDYVTICPRQTLSLNNCPEHVLPAPRISAKVPDQTWKLSVAHLTPPQKAVESYAQTLRGILGVHLFNFDLLPVLFQPSPMQSTEKTSSAFHRFAVVDVNHFPGFKDVPDISLQMRTLLKQALVWNMHIPKRVVLIGCHEVVNKVAWELAQRLQCSVQYTKAFLPSMYVEHEFSFGITAMHCWLHPSCYRFHRDVVALSLQVPRSSIDFRKTTLDAIECGLLEFANKFHAFYCSPPSIKNILQSFLNAKLSLADMVDRLVKAVALDFERLQYRDRINVAYMDDLSSICATAAWCWFRLLRGHVPLSRRVNMNRTVAEEQMMQRKRAVDTAPSPHGGWNAETTRERCSSGPQNENEFIVIETKDCYQKYIAPRLMREPLPRFLADLMACSQPMMISRFDITSHSHIRLSECDTPLYCCIDTPFGGWLLSPNPKYCDPLRSMTLEEAQSIPFIAYWIAPMWYTDLFKANLADIACRRLLHYDINQQASHSTLFKPDGGYLHTLRDVTDVRIFECLQNGASRFFMKTFGLALDTLLVDMHYMPQLLYTTLHVHFRKPREYSALERTCRFKLADVISKLNSGTPIERWQFMYRGRFNSFHGIWQLLYEFVIPFEVLDFGPSMATLRRSPVMVLGEVSGNNGNRAGTASELLSASEICGFVPTDMMCDDIEVSSLDQTNQVFAQSVELIRLCSIPIDGDVRWMYVFESPCCYDGLRQFYRTQTLPSFLHNIVHGQCEQEFRCTTDRIPLFSIISNEDGSGWFLCPNVKYHPPSVPIQLPCSLNFIAWWIHPQWLPNLKSCEARLSPRPVRTWNSALNLLRTSTSTQCLSGNHDYLYSIRDCTSIGIFQSLLTGARQFFETIGVASLEEFEVIDTHYPPSSNYSTLHVHFRSKASFSSNQWVMRFPIHSVMIRLQKHPHCLRDGTVRFFYPHHTGRSLWAAAEQNFVDFQPIEYGARYPASMPHYYVKKRGEESTAEEDPGFISSFFANNAEKSAADSPLLCPLDVRSITEFDRVAGKRGMLKERTHGYVLKPIFSGLYENAEADFYAEITSRPSKLSFIVPYFGEVHHCPGVPTSSLHEHRSDSYLILQDVTCLYEKSCVMDVKIGAQSFPPTASAFKKNLESKKCASQASDGYRINGMLVWDERAAARLRTAREEVYQLFPTSRVLAFQHFLRACVQTETKLRYVQSFLDRLTDIESWFSEQSEFLFYGSSLLFIYEASQTSDDRADLYLIDMANIWNMTSGQRYSRRKQMKMNEPNVLVSSGSSARDENFLHGLRVLKSHWWELYRKLQEDGDGS